MAAAPDALLPHDVSDRSQEPRKPHQCDAAQHESLGDVVAGAVGERLAAVARPRRRALSFAAQRAIARRVLRRAPWGRRVAVGLAGVVAAARRGRAVGGGGGVVAGRARDGAREAREAAAFRALRAVLRGRRRLRRAAKHDLRLLSGLPERRGLRLRDGEHDHRAAVELQVRVRGHQRLRAHLRRAAAALHHLGLGGVRRLPLVPRPRPAPGALLVRGARRRRLRDRGRPARRGRPRGRAALQRGGGAGRRALRALDDARLPGLLRQRRRRRRADGHARAKGAGERARSHADVRLPRPIRRQHRRRGLRRPLHERLAVQRVLREGPELLGRRRGLRRRRDRHGPPQLLIRLRAADRRAAAAGEGRPRDAEFDGARPTDRVLRELSEERLEPLAVQGHVLLRLVPVPHAPRRVDLHDRGRRGQARVGGRPGPPERDLLPRRPRPLHPRPLARQAQAPRPQLARDDPRHLRLPQRRRHALLLLHDLRRRPQPVLLPRRGRPHGVTTRRVRTKSRARGRPTAPFFVSGSPPPSTSSSRPSSSSRWPTAATRASSTAS